MRVTALLVLILVALTVSADETPWRLDDRARAERRADPVRNAARHAAWVANGRPGQSAQENVVEGSFDVSVLAPIELIDQVIPVFNLQREQQEKFRREWRARGAAEVLGHDFWDKLRAVLAPAIAVEHENRRIGALPPAAHNTLMQSRRDEQFSDGGECATRAEVLVAARAAWGESFDRFLYEVVAPGVHFSSSCSDPELMTRPEFWLAEWRSMEEGCK